MREDIILNEPTQRDDQRSTLQVYDQGAVCPVCNWTSLIGTVYAKIKIFSPEDNGSKNVLIDKNQLLHDPNALVYAECPNCGHRMIPLDKNSVKAVAKMNEAGFYVQDIISHLNPYYTMANNFVQFLLPIPDDAWRILMDQSAFTYSIQKSTFNHETEGFDLGQTITFSYIDPKASSQKDRIVTFRRSEYERPRTTDWRNQAEIFAGQLVNREEKDALRKYADENLAKYKTYQDALNALAQK